MSAVLVPASMFGALVLVQTVAFFVVLRWHRQRLFTHFHACYGAGCVAIALSIVVAAVADSISSWPHYRPCLLLVATALRNAVMVMYVRYVWKRSAAAVPDGVWDRRVLRSLMYACCVLALLQLVIMVTRCARVLDRTGRDMAGRFAVAADVMLMLAVVAYELQGEWMIWVQAVAARRQSTASASSAQVITVAQYGLVSSVGVLAWTMNRLTWRMVDCRCSSALFTSVDGAALLVVIQSLFWMKVKLLRSQSDKARRTSAAAASKTAQCKIGASNVIIDSFGSDLSGQGSDVAPDTAV